MYLCAVNGTPARAEITHIQIACILAGERCLLNHFTCDIRFLQYRVTSHFDGMTVADEAATESFLRISGFYCFGIYIFGILRLLIAFRSDAHKADESIS